MTTDIAASTSAPRSFLRGSAPLLAALIYPLLLALLFHSAELLHHGNQAARALVALALLATLAVPAFALVSVAQLGAGEAPSIGDVTARRFMHLAFASAPLFTLFGVLSTMAGWPSADNPLWALIWILAITMLAWRIHDTSPAIAIKPAPAWLRVSHGVAAALVLTGFISLHFINHLAGLDSAETHIAVMKVFRLWYRQRIVEPVLVALMLFMVMSGFVLLRARLARSAGFFETLQTTTGAYLLFYIPGHMNSVFFYQRTFLGNDSDFWFAAGGPAGVLGDPWSVRLLPHYALGVWAIVTHAACGLRTVMLAHGAREALADRVVIVLSTLGVLLATAMVLPLCRVHLMQG